MPAPKFAFLEKNRCRLHFSDTLCPDTCRLDASAVDTRRRHPARFFASRSRTVSTGAQNQHCPPGASAYAPEHTLAAYRLAIDQGADYVEPDLQLTKDGVLVCLHDVTLERTTNVRTVYPDRARLETVDGQTRRVWPVADFTLEELKRLDAGSWFGPQFAGEQIPTFQEMIDTVRGRAGLYPEIKSPAKYAALGFDMPRALLDVLRKTSLTAPALTHVPQSSSSRLKPKACVACAGWAAGCRWSS